MFSAKRVFWIVALTVLGLMLVAPVGAADSSWQASYWNNTTLSGTPALVRQENELNHNWGANAPAVGINADQFSARWVRTINIGSGGTYRFTATTDDGMRVWVDNVLVIDSWWDSQVHSLHADRQLAAGDHTIKVEYYEAGGQAVAQLTWQLLGSTGGGIWRGEYYNNTSLAGLPAVIRNDERIDFDWATGAPAAGVPADQFSVRWTRQANLQGGRYEFTVRADDGVRVWANGQLVIDRWHEAQGQFYQTTVDLPAGTVPLRVEYYENQGGAIILFNMVRVGNSSAGVWRGEYYSNRNLSGSPVLTRDDSQINFNWGSGSPASTIPSDNFSVRWTRNMSFVAGTYRFTVNSDDGARVWVNGQQIINNWTDQPPNTVSGDITLSSGTVPIQVEYYEAGGGAQIQFSWALVNILPAPAPVPLAGTASVVSAQLNVRCGPGLGYTILTTVPRGTTFTLAGYRAPAGSWVLVNFNGGQAWVSSLSAYLLSSVNIANLPVWTGNFACPTPAATGTTAVVTNAQHVNLRQNPFVGQNIITSVLAGTTVELLARNQQSSWLKIRLPNQTVGWMNAYYLNTSMNISTLPVAAN